MKITKVYVDANHRGTRLLATASVCFDDLFMVHDFRIVDGDHGPFVCMPSRQLYSQCPRCSLRNPRSAKFCNECAERLRDEGKKFIDIAHPIVKEFRNVLTDTILKEYRREEADPSAEDSQGCTTAGRG